MSSRLRSFQTHCKCYTFYGQATGSYWLNGILANSLCLFIYVCRYSSCHDLLLSRFCAADYRDYGIIGIKIHRITRIHNRMLRTKFDDKVAQLVEEEEQASITAMSANVNTNSSQIPNQQATSVQAPSGTTYPATKYVTSDLVNSQLVKLF